MKIGVSFLKSKFSLKETISKIEKTDADYIHVDICDGIYAPHKNIEVSEVISLLKNTKKEIDLHLMVKNPSSYIQELAVLKPSFMTIHSDIENIEDMIALIKSYNIKVGIAISPDIDIENIKAYLPLINYCLIMGVNPGLGGQQMILSTISKIEKLNNLRKENHYNYIISFDGGVNADTIKYIKGADLCVTGSYICMNDDYQMMLDKLRRMGE